MFTLLRHRYPEIAHNLTHSVTLGFGPKSGFKNNAGLGPDSGFKMRPVYHSERSNAWKLGKEKESQMTIWLHNIFWQFKFQDTGPLERPSTVLLSRLTKRSQFPSCACLLFLEEQSNPALASPKSNAEQTRSAEW